MYVAYEFRQQHRHETVSLYLSVGNSPFWISISIQIEWKSGYESGSIQTLTVEHMLLNRNVRNSVRCRLHFRTEHVDFLNIISGRIAAGLRIVTNMVGPLSEGPQI